MPRIYSVEEAKYLAEGIAKFVEFEPYRGLDHAGLMAFCRRFNCHETTVRSGAMDGAVDFFVKHRPKAYAPSPVKPVEETEVPLFRTKGSAPYVPYHGLRKRNDMSNFLLMLQERRGERVTEEEVRSGAYDVLLKFWLPSRGLEWCEEAHGDFSEEGC